MDKSKTPSDQDTIKQHQVIIDQQDYAMERYLEYLNNDAQPINKDEYQAFHVPASDWWIVPVVYPPHED